MKLYGICTVFNEAYIAKTVMKYAELLGYDRFIAYNNGSTDETVNLISQYPFIEVRDFDTNGVFDDTKRLNLIYNTIFELRDYHRKTYGNELAWVYIGDFDEVVFYNMADTASSLKGYIENMTFCGYNVCSETIVNLLVPKDSEAELNNSLPHDIEKARISYQTPFAWEKPTLFRLDNLNDICLTLGWHFCCFDYGNEEPKQFFNNRYVCRFHLKHLTKTGFMLHRKDLSTRSYSFDGKEGDSMYDERDNEKLSNDWNGFFQKGIPVKTYMENKLLNGNDADEHGHQIVRFGDYIWGKVKGI